MLGDVESSSYGMSTTDLEAKLACYLSYFHMQPTEVEDEFAKWLF